MTVDNEPVIKLAGIWKTFPGGVVANRGAELSIRAGEIHAIVGENGAGKSTLMNVIYGLHQPERGTIQVHGKNVSIPNPRMAKSLGIGMVHQHFMLVPSFTVLQNVILGYEPKKWGAFIDQAAAARDIRALCERYHMTLPLEPLVRTLPVGLQQQIEIVKAIYRGAEILILDEPTAVLTPKETVELFQVCREMAHQGKTVIFISHKLREVLDVSDRITVMRHGETVCTVNAKETTEKDLACLIVGREHLWNLQGKPQRQISNPILSVKSLFVRGRENTWAVKDLSLEVRAGEIVGIAGVEGNGQSELISALAGLQIAESGRVCFREQDITATDAARRRSIGIRHIPEDRMETGLSLTATLEENLIIDPADRTQFVKSGAIRWENVRRHCAEKIAEYSIVARDPGVPAGTLSGGNLQKLVAARELSPNQACLLVAHPTRGLDIGASEFIYDRLFDARAQGCGILLVSADLDEIFLLSDRILVIYRGQIAAECQPETTTPEEIGLYMTGAGRKVEEQVHDPHR